MAKSRSRANAQPSAGKRKATSKTSRASRGGGRSRAAAETPAKLRTAIDRVDQQILKLIDERATLVEKLGKLDQGDVVGRVAEASRRIERLCEAGSKGDPSIAPSKKAEVLRHISSVCLSPLHQLRVAYLGPPHSYSHLAAIKYFGDAANLVPVASIPAVFDAVSRHDAVTGIVPIENSTDGRVVDTLGMFIRRRMQICGEVLLPIHHNLLSRTPRAEVTEVYSKPQALSQCRTWLANQLPHAALIEVNSTAAAARLAADKPGAAAVASREAARQHELDVLDANIEDNPNNVTRFAVLGRDQPAPTGDDKTAILFQLKHQPGTLADAMAIFKRRSLNLTWIESFPMPEQRSEYLFFVELSGHRDEPQVAAALKSLAKHTERQEVLGSYPRAALPG